MAKTVNGAFDEFLANTVRISATTSEKAKGSRNFLKNEIKFLSDNNYFLMIAPTMHCNYGSFERKTKTKPLNDIDLIIALNGSIAELSNDYSNSVTIKYTGNDKLYKQVCDQNYYFGTYTINSTKVNNLLKKALSNISQYENAEIHTRGEAVTLKLKSYDWTFDIVPAFFTLDEKNNKVDYYYIPDGNGRWKKTNPIKEKERIKSLNKYFDGKVYDVVRLVKYWNARAKIKTITSYVLEAMVLDYFEKQVPYKGENEWVDLHFRNFLGYMSDNIKYPINDPKGIEGNINKLTYIEQKNIAERAKNDYEKAKLAVDKELEEKDHQSSINIWKDIFGDEFPKYE